MENQFFEKIPVEIKPEVDDTYFVLIESFGAFINTIACFQKGQWIYTTASLPIPVKFWLKPLHKIELDDTEINSLVMTIFPVKDKQGEDHKINSRTMYIESMNIYRDKIRSTLKNECNPNCSLHRFYLKNGSKCCKEWSE